MTTRSHTTLKGAFAWRANTVVGALFLGVCGLVIFTGVAAYSDARQVMGSFEWFKNNIRAGLTAEVCRSQLIDGRLEQCKYALTGDPSFLRQAAAHLENSYGSLKRMQWLYVQSGAPQQARKIERLLTQFERTAVVRQERAEADARAHGDAVAAARFKGVLLREADNQLLQNVVDFKRATTVEIMERGKAFFNQLQRTSTNGALLAMLIGLAVLLGLSQRLLKERRKTEERVLFAEQRIRAVVDNMFDALLAIDEKGIIRAANLRAADPLDYPAGALVGMHINDLLPEADGVAHAQSEIRELRARKSTGELFAAEVGVRTIAAGAAMSSVSRLVTIRDITQRLEAAQMRQNFIDTATENLQEPLVQIADAVSDVVSGSLGEIPGKALETLNIAQRNSRRLMGLLNDLLDLERLESGTMKMSVQSASAPDIVERSLESVKALAEMHKVQLQSEISARDLTADADRMVQVLVNFLSNAIKFSPQGGLVRVCAVEENGFVEFRVIDQGRGIPEHMVASVFERFQQTEAADAKKGTGLGLPICKMIVENHGGQIGAVSQLGKGTTFYARIPRTQLSAVA